MRHAIPAMVVLSVVLAQPQPSGAEPLRLAGAVYRGEKLDEGLSDLLAVELSRQEDAEALERRQLHFLLREQGLNALISDSWRQARMGRLLGVDAFVWVRIRGDQAVLELVDAPTGRGIAVEQEALGADVAKALSGLAERAVRAARRGPPPVDKTTATLAVAKPTFEAGAEALGQAVETALQALAQELSRAGVALLHRRFVEDLVLERWMLDKGLTASERRQLPMLGARCILVPRVEKEEPGLVLSLLETATGRRLGHRAWPLGDAEASRAVIAAWVRQRIEPQAAPERRETSKAPKTDTPLQPETLAPFYRGMLLHNEGRYLDAAVQFRAAMRFDRRFLDPFRWIQSCFVGAGFDEVAEAFAGYVAQQRKDVWSGIHSPRALHAAQGVALVGLSAPPQVSSPQRLAATVALMDGLHEASGAPVLVTADMAQLRDELDALLGLDHVAGPTWQQAPPLLFADTLTADLRPEGGGVALRLCVAHELDPGQIAAIALRLDPDPAKWQKQIAAAYRPFLAQAPAARPAWKRPAPILPDRPPKDRPANEEEYALNCLHRVARDPQDVTGLRFPHHTDWFQNVMMPGLHRWFVRTLPDASEVKPWVEFAYVTYYARGPEQLRRLSEKYPSNPVGLLARLRVLLAEVDDGNLPQTQAALEKLLADLKPHVPGAFSRQDYEGYVHASRLLRRALGMPDGPGELKPAGRLWAMMSGDGPIRIQGGRAFPGAVKFTGRGPMPQQQALIDLAVLRCSWRGEHGIPATTIKEVFERFEKEPDALAYFCVTYNSHLFWNRSPAPSEDDCRVLAAVYPKQARIVVSLLGQDPLPFDWMGANSLVCVDTLLAHHGTKDPAFRAAREEVRRAIQEAITTGRFRNLTPIQLFALLGSIARRGDPTMLPYLKALADRSLAADPLEDRFWRVYMHWDPFPKAREQAKLYLPFYERVRKLHGEIAPTPQTAALYFDFGLVFFRGGRCDLAEEPLLAIANLDGPRVTALPDLKANACYLLALIRQRDKNVPEALRWAKRAVDEAGDRIIGLISGISIGGGRHGQGSTSNLKSLATDLMAKLRANPNAPFQSPFGDP